MTIVRQSKKLLPFSDIKRMDANLTTEQALENLIPKGFESMFSVNVNHNGDIELVFNKAENQSEASVKISQSIFNPKENLTSFPKFLLQVSTFKKKHEVSPDYMDKQSRYVLNQNEILYTIIHHRVTKFMAYANSWIGLLQRDIARLRTFMDYNVPNSYNARRKAENIYVILDPFVKSSSMANPSWKKINSFESEEIPLGELIEKKANDEILKCVMNDLRIHPASESMLQKAGKVVVSTDNNLYKCPGFYCADKDKNGNDDKFIVSIFPPKQNVPARLKTHLIGDALEAKNYIANPLYLEDYISENGKLVAKDKCLLGAIVVFDEIDVSTGRFVFGEVEQTTALAKQPILKKEIVHEQFTELLCEVGTKSIGNKLILGIGLDGQQISINGILSGEVVYIKHDEVNQSAKIVCNTYLEAGNARIINPFGLKGFTKTRPNLGYITLNNNNKKLSVSLITGMNGVKGKGNCIAAAMAGLAFKEGIYQNNLPYLRSLNIPEINKAAKALGKVKYTNEYGVTKEVFAGYVEYSVTELGIMYSKYRPQNFMFEVGKYLEMQSDKSLFNFIWKDCIDNDLKTLALELHKILIDKVGYFAAEEKLPVYTPAKMLEIFKSTDLILSSQSRWDSDSKLFDESFNKGFYIDLRKIESIDSNNVKHYGPMIRIPCAKSLNAIKGQLPNGGFIYPKIIVVLSKIIQQLIVKNQENGRYNIGYIWNMSGKKHVYQSYIEEAQGMLYSNEEKGMTMAQSLIKPQVLGLNMKQITDYLVPWNVVVIFDDKKYQEILETVSIDVYENKFLGSLIEQNKDIYGLAIRNPA